MDTAAVSGESIILRLTYNPVPSKKYFSLDYLSLFTIHSCERLLLGYLFLEQVNYHVVLMLKSSAPHSYML